MVRTIRTRVGHPHTGSSHAAHLSLSIQSEGFHDPAEEVSLSWHLCATRTSSRTRQRFGAKYPHET